MDLPDGLPGRSLPFRLGFAGEASPASSRSSIPPWRDRASIQRGLFEGLLDRFPTLGSCRVNRRTRKLEVKFDPARLGPPEILDAAQSILAAVRPGAPRHCGPRPDGPFQPEPTLLVDGAETRSSSWPSAGVPLR